MLSYLHQPVINPSTLKETISGFIGIFCLDPNRVLDILLDACEFEPEKYPLFKGIFNEFKVSEIPQFIEFKFLYYQSQEVLLSIPCDSRRSRSRSPCFTSPSNS